MEYIKERFTLPVPLNLIPTPIGTYQFIKTSIKFYKDKKFFKSFRRSRNISSMTEDTPSFYEMKSQQDNEGHNVSTKSINDSTKVRKKESTQAINVENLENHKLTYKVAKKN